MRCSVCHRRLIEGAACSLHQDGSSSQAPASESAPAVPTIDGYSQLRPLGGGGFANVYLARPDENPADEVAIKLAMAAGDERFLREAAALRLLRPPLVPQWFGDGVTEEGRPFLVMQRVRGRLFADWLAERESALIPPAEALPNLRLLGVAVDEMHRAGVLHRDLKPENVFLCDGPHVTLIDFGLARPIDERAKIAEETPHLTRTGQIMGTALYMAPEQCSGAEQSQPQTDLYALGVIAFECLTGRPPFVGATAEVQNAHVSRMPPRVSEFVALGPAVDEVLAKALAKEPGDRHASAGDFVEALQRAADARTSSSAAPVSAPERPSKPKSTRVEAALLAVRCSLTSKAVSDAVAPDGGLIARTADDLHLVVFPDALTPAAGVRSALRSAERMASVAESSVVHVASVRIRSSKRRTTMLGHALDHTEEWASADVRGVAGKPLLTPEATALLSSGTARAVGETGWSTISVSGHGARLRAAQEAPLIGRDSVVEEIVGEAKGCQSDGAPRLATILGESGVGKSRVLGAVRDALGNSFSVIWLSGRHPDTSQPNELLKEFLQRAFALPPEPDAGRVRSACEAALGDEAETLWPAVAFVAGAIDEDQPALASLRQAPGALRHSVAKALAAALMRASAETPTAVFVDDAQWADPEVLDALELATMAPGGYPLWVCVAATEQPTSYREAWGSRARAHKTEQLGPLEEKAARELARILLQPAEFVPESTLAALSLAAARMPLYLVEIVHMLRVSGALRKLPGTSSWVIDTEDLLQPSAAPMAERLAQRAQSALPADQLALARLCAILGDPFDQRDVEGVRQFTGIGASDVVTSVGLNRLVDMAVLQRAGPGVFRFRSPLLRQGIEALAPPRERRALHDAARQYLAAAPDLEARLSQLARHSAACGAREQASECYLKLAEQARSRHQYGEAEQLYSAALGQLDSAHARERETALVGRGKMRYRLWRAAEAREDFQTALELARARGDTRTTVELMLEQATVLDWAHEFATSTTLVEQAAKEAEGIDDTLLSLRLLFAAGRSHFRLERLPEAIDALGQACDKARELDEYEIRALSLLMLGPTLVYADRLEEAERRFADVIELCEDAGDSIHIGAAYVNRMLLWNKRRSLDRALADAEAGMQVAREIGLVALEQGAAYNRAELLLWMGKTDEALQNARRSLELERYCEHKKPEIPLLCARIHAAKDDVAEAAALANELLQRSAAQLVPSQKILLDMVERSCREDATSADWLEVLRGAEEHSMSDERLEVLHACASAAARQGWSELLETCLRDARELAGDAAEWRRRFDEFGGN